MELPSTNIARNFPGVDATQYYTIADMLECDEGTTDTDSMTEGNDAPKDYSNINKKQGKVRKW